MGKTAGTLAQIKTRTQKLILYFVDIVYTIMHSKEKGSFSLRMSNGVIKNFSFINSGTLIKKNWVISYFVLRIVLCVTEKTSKKHMV